MSYALQVDIRIKPESVDAFMAKLAANAADARTEPGCRQFDVLVDPADPAPVMLYEIYAPAPHPGRRFHSPNRGYSPSPCRGRAFPGLLHRSNNVVFFECFLYR